MTVYGSALLLPVCGLLVAFGAVPSPSRLVYPAGRTTPDPTHGSTSGRPAVPPAHTGLGGSTATATRSGPSTASGGMVTGTIGSGGIGNGPGAAGGTARSTADGMPAGGTPVSVKPVETVSYETETERIPYRTRVVRDPSMPRGSRAERTAGVPGERTLRYEVTTVDGKRTGRRLVGSAVTRAPVTRVVAAGTRRGNGRPDQGCRHGNDDHVSYGGDHGSGDHGGGDHGGGDHGGGDHAGGDHGGGCD